MPAGASGTQVEERWVEISKRDLVEEIRGGRITILLATDAASEGLNLQACSYLVNFDMPWNPMRAEQRIGRIDRLGQLRPVVTVKNYFVPGTVEESVYAALRARIDDFADLLGNLQPILGATEEAFRTIFRAPRSERKRAEEEAIRSLDDTIERVRRLASISRSRIRCRCRRTSRSRCASATFANSSGTRSPQAVAP